MKKVVPAKVIESCFECDRIGYGDVCSALQNDIDVFAPIPKDCPLKDYQERLGVDEELCPLGHPVMDCKKPQWLIKPELIKAYEEYIELLDSELNKLNGLAWVHGYRCPQERIEQGKICRDKIAQFKATIPELPEEVQHE